MIVARQIGELNRARIDLGGDSLGFGFVPTMGALHAGHLSLVALAKQKSDRVVVSIYVNPTQFGPNEDFARYPRTPEKDLEMLEAAGVDLVWMPRAADMYEPNEMITVDPGPVGNTYEGAIRPGHFRGVLTVVAKLFHQIRPTVAVFGQKDGQQLFLIKKMVRELQFPLDVVSGETLREADGLAKSSRNIFLKRGEREAAPALFQALSHGFELIKRGEREVSVIEQAMQHELKNDEMSIDYLTCVQQSDFSRPEIIEGQGLLIGAVRLGSVRLIDNLIWGDNYSELIDDSTG